LNIIPHTADVTIIADYAVGTVVNVEVDILARYIERLLSKDGDGISIEFLKAHGYA
jgi:riboflavin synthase